MPIEFSKSRWDKIREDYARWWAGELKRPLFQLRPKRDPGRPAPGVSGECPLLMYDPDAAPERIVDIWDYELSCIKYVGDSFPCYWPNFGPGAVGVFMGAKAAPEEETVWIMPPSDRGIRDIHLRFDPDNAIFKHHNAICRAAMDRWNGLVQMSMTDLGGNLDVVAIFRPGEKLLFDLYDNPDEVKRLVWEAHSAWWAYYRAISDMYGARNPGYTAWLPMLSDGPYYVLQCDFCYMIGPDMFDEFVRPEIAATAKKLKNSFYHLDGVGSLPHLDSILSIPEIKGIQWVFGDGKPGVLHWPHVYRKIRDADKLLYLSCSFDEFDTVVNRLGSAEGIILRQWETNESETSIREFLSKYGAL